MLVEKSQISLNKVRIYAYHGVLPQEKKVGGWYNVSVTIDYDFSKAIISDNVEDTIDYSAVLGVIKNEMSVPSKLLENLAGRIGKALFSTFPDIEALEISVEKENPPMGSDISGACVLLRLKNDKTFR